MSMRPIHPRSALLLAVPALLFAGIAFSQDQSDRPPWAQKPKSIASANSTSATSANGEPGKIVQPTPPAATNDSQAPPAHPAPLPPDATLLTLLPTVSHDTNRP